MRTTDTATFGYMQARIQARHGDRLDQEQWRQLDTCRDLGRYLQLARESNLRQWVQHFAAQDEPARWEDSLRHDWTRNLQQVAKWVPDDWHASILWLETLPMLPAISHMLNGEPAAPWVHAEPFFSELDLTDGQTFRDALNNSHWHALLHHRDPDHPVESWLAAWRALWPAGNKAVAADLEQACKELASAWDSADEQSEWRRALEARFTKLLRRHTRTILALLGHIGLVSLDMAHLRGGLIRLHIAGQLTKAAA